MAFDAKTGEIYTGASHEVPSGHIAMGSNAHVVDMAQHPQATLGDVRTAAQLHVESLGGQKCVQSMLADDLVELVTHPRS